MSKYTKEERLTHIEQQRTSGLSIQGYCELQGINHSTFQYWLKRDRLSKRKSIGFREVTRPVSNKNSSVVRILFPNGLAVELPMS